MHAAPCSWAVVGHLAKRCMFMLCCKNMCSRLTLVCLAVCVGFLFVFCWCVGLTTLQRRFHAGVLGCLITQHMYIIMHGAVVCDG